MTLTNFFNSIAEQYDKQLPFVAYRKPNTTKVLGLLQETPELHFATHFTEKGFVFSPFDAIENTVLLPLEQCKTMFIDDCNLEGVTSSEDKKNTSIPNNNSKHQHIRLVEKGIEAIKNKTFKKVVLSRKEDVALSNDNPIDFFKRLLNRYTSAFVYCWYHPKVGLWLGATPETLIKIEGHRFSIMALAGTQNYKGTLDVIWQDKEKEEQQFVTDFIIDNIAPSVDNIKVTERETVKAGNLLHLKTMISAQLKPESSNLKEIISVLHPTPAVCGLPKEEAKKFILKHEHYNREFYSGFLGELNLETKVAPRSGKRNIENRAYTLTRKSTQLYVNLRCMQLNKSEATVYVGGGITKTSQPEKEWEETVSKTITMKKILY